jgi:hypothetical protein
VDSLEPPTSCAEIAGTNEQMAAAKGAAKLALRPKTWRTKTFFTQIAAVLHKARSLKRDP